MATLPTDLRNKLEKAVTTARNLAEKAGKAALEALAVHHHEPYGHMTVEQRKLRNQLRARARQAGDVQDGKGVLSIKHLAHECAYEHWHRMLFARFLAENNLLIEPHSGVAISLDECKQLAKAEKTDLWTLAGRYAQKMLPEVFRADDPLLQVTLAREDQLKLEQLLDGLSAAVFPASDSLGWCYQFWQTERKQQVNDSGDKIGADELPAVTQLFTEDYMVDFLLDNTLGAWWAGKVLAAKPKLAESAKSEEELRKAVALPGCPWKYLRFIKGKDGQWRPAAGTFDGWPKTAKELKCLDPCMGSGHFVVAMFERLVALRMAEEKLAEKNAVESVIRANLFGLEIDPRCTQIGAFNLALAAWRRVGHRALPAMHLACSGLAPNTKLEDWLKIAGSNDKLRQGMQRLYQLFQKAPVLGSLINPHASEGDLLVAAFHELQPLLERALAQESKDDTAHEMAVTARGVAKAAEILAGQFTLVATNVPYLGRNKQDEVLMDYCERVHPEAKADLSNCFVERCLSFCVPSGSSALVTPQNWLFQGAAKDMRQRILQTIQWDFATGLGPRSFQTPMWDFSIALLGITQREPSASHRMMAINVSEKETPDDKAAALVALESSQLNQQRQLGNPDGRLTWVEIRNDLPLLNQFADSYQGLRTGDIERFSHMFWEVNEFGDTWTPLKRSSNSINPFDGIQMVLLWQGGRGQLHDNARLMRDQLHDMHESGNKAWGKLGVALNQINLGATFYSGQKYDFTITVIVPKREECFPAIWCYCSSSEFEMQLRALDQRLSITNQTMLKVPFDLTHWQKVAAEKYPHGLPKPFSSDPTQWLFNGHPKGSDAPLHVAVARLLDYGWPRQTGSSFPDCPSLGEDGLEKFADADGIVCIPSVRGEEPAADRLSKLLAVAYGKDWKPTTELELIHATGSDAGDFDEWLRNDFFEQHCDLFHQRPFIWHIWDGRKRDGFHALVNYHKLAGSKGRKLLESLTHSYLGDWIIRQRDGVKRGDEGAEERLAAAQALKERLEAIIEGEPPYDLFIRWKPLSEQPIGWEPDINDGVRLNIRPFLASDLPNGKKGAGILRSRPNIKWDKDRGKEPVRDKKDFPWFWGWDESFEDFPGTKEFDGNRWNDCHYTNEAKREAAEKEAKK